MSGRFGKSEVDCAQAKEVTEASGKAADETMRERRVIMCVIKMVFTAHRSDG